jgi:hypothetical protein
MSVEPAYRTALLTRQPFWEELSPTVIKQRIDQILADPNSAAIVHTLSPVEFMLLLKEAPETCPLLLELAQPQQIRTVLDLDCWDKDTLQSPRVLQWLEELQRSGSRVFLQALQVMDIELLIATFRQYIRVQAALPPEEADEPSNYDEALANELYRVELVESDTPLSASVLRLLSFLRMVDLDLYLGLMQGIMWGQDSELEEWAYRWKSGRLQDEGFPDYYDALETRSLIDLAQSLPHSATPPPVPGMPESVETTGLIPGYAWGLTPSGSLLAQALAGDFSPETQERLCWEMVSLCNRELVLDQVDFADAAAVRASLQRVHAVLNVGVEYLSDQQTLARVPLLTAHSLQFIYQVGFTVSIRLHQRALRLQTALDREAGVRRALPGLARQVIDGLLRQPPQFFIGLERPGETGYRDFLSLQDITLVAPLLTALEHDPAYHVLGPSA